MACHLVWFKRDLRVEHHAALTAALAQARAEGVPVLALYVREPSVWGAADASARQWGFVRESLRELRRHLSSRGIPMLFATAEMLPVLQALRAHLGIRALWAHEETGVAVTYARDQAVAGWCREQAIAFHEIPQTGVLRGLRDRRQRDWAAHWEQFTQQPLPAEAGGQIRPELPALTLPEQAFSWHDGAPDIGQRQPGGRAHGLALLHSFLHYRAPSYRRGLGSPLTASSTCSRLSPYLAWGCVSIAEVAQATQAAMMTEAGRPEMEKTPGKLVSLRAFHERLAWHCHFIQKFETEPSLETQNTHSGFDGLREHDFRRDWFEAWCAGETGWPMVDACMKCLNATGWINFRMRAMLLSSATYPLWLHWREPALHLARQFVDYEPGIHYPQVQMQAGVTGINAMRVYHPTKQARDHDPDGHFIKRWLPALSQVPDGFLAEPWTLPANLQRHYGVRIGRDYPAPLTPLEAALRESKARMARRRAELRGSAETERVLTRLASRKRQRADAASPHESRPRTSSAAAQLKLW